MNRKKLWNESLNCELKNNSTRYNKIFINISSLQIKNKKKLLKNLLPTTICFFVNTYLLLYKKPIKMN